MKANEAPEKIYLEREIETDRIQNLWGINPVVSSLYEHIEYCRTEVFIEKACEYISEHIEYYMKKDKTCNVPLCPLFATQSFIENFRKYMKGD